MEPCRFNRERGVKKKGKKEKPHNYPEQSNCPYIQHTAYYMGLCYVESGPDGSMCFLYVRELHLTSKKAKQDGQLRQSFASGPRFTPRLEMYVRTEVGSLSSRFYSSFTFRLCDTGANIRTPTTHHSSIQRPSSDIGHPTLNTAVESRRAILSHSTYCGCGGPLALLT